MMTFMHFLLLTDIAFCNDVECNPCDPSLPSCLTCNEGWAINPALRECVSKYHALFNCFFSLVAYFIGMAYPEESAVGMCRTDRNVFSLEAVPAHAVLTSDSVPQQQKLPPPHHLEHMNSFSAFAVIIEASCQL